MNEISEEMLVQRAQNEEAAKEALFLRCYDRLLRLVRRNLPLALEHLVSPEDILQDTFALAFQNFTSFRFQGEGSFYRWVATIARNRLANVLESEQAQKRGGGGGIGRRINLSDNDSASTAMGVLYLLARGEKSPRQLASDKEAIALVQSALDRLTGEQAQAIQLRYGEGLSVAGAAHRMNRTEQAVKMLCFRALRELRSLFPRSSRDATPSE